MFEDFLDVLADDTFDEVPVDLKTFVEDPHYMNLPPMSPKQLHVLEAMTQILYPDTLDMVYADNPQYAQYLKNLKVKELVAMVGKGCVTGDTLMLTSDGWKRASDVGRSKVWTRDGFEESSAALPVGKERTLRVTTYHGYDITVHQHHKVMTKHGWLSANKLKPGMKLLIDTSQKDTPGLDMTNDEAWWLGALFGDGSFPSSKPRSRAPRFTNVTPAVSEKWVEISNRADSIDVKHEYSGYGADRYVASGVAGRGENYWINFCRRYGLEDSKHWNDELLNMSPVQTAHFINGLISTDGSINSNGGVDIGISNEGVMKGVQQLLLNIGVVSRLRVRSFDNPNHKDNWRMYIPKSQASKIWELSGKCVGKEDRCTEFISTGSVYTEIVSIEDAGFQPIYDFIVSPSEEYTTGALVSHNGGKNHTTITAVCRVVYLLLCMKDPASYYGKPPGDAIHILNIAVNSSQAQNTFFTPLKLRIEASPWFRGKFDAGRAGMIKFDKNVTAYSGHSQREAWEGYNLIFVVLDEIAAFKCQPLSSKVLTPLGWTTMGQVEAGDFVVGANGSPVEVLGKFPQSTREVYEVAFEDGSVVECSDDHLWTVDEYSNGLRKSRKTLELKDFKSLKVRDSQYRYSVPNISMPVEFSDSPQLPIPPYSMGVLISEGELTSGAKFTSGDPEIGKYVESEIPGSHRMSQSGIEYRICSEPNKPNIWLNSIREFGLDKTSYYKFIPSVYLKSSIEDRISLLRGLMDGDGTVGNSASYCTTSETLANNVVELCRSLGGSPKVSSYKYENARFWIVHTRTPMNPFRLERKASAWKPINKTLNRSIVDVRRTGRFEEMACILVDSEDHLYVTDSFIVTHNTSAESTGMSSRADTAPEMYKMYKASITSRFPDVGKLCLLSFPRFAGDYITERFNEVALEKERIEYSEDFPVNPEIPMSERNKITVDWFEEEVLTYKEPYVLALRIPSWKFNPQRTMQDYIGEFFRDMPDALARFACNPPDSIDSFFTDKEKVHDSFKEVRHPFEDNWQFMPSFVGNPSTRYYMHVDLAQKSDRAAISIAHVEDWVRVGSGIYQEVQPVIKIDAVRWWTPTPGKNVDFTDIKNYINAIKRRGFNLTRVTFDRWAGSVGLQHELARDGVEVETLSVGRGEYNDFQLAVYDGRLRGYHLPLLVDEILGLRVDDKGRIDHTATGSNDLADAVAGSAHLCLKYEERPEDGEIDILYLDDMEERSNKIGSLFKPKKEPERPTIKEVRHMPAEVEMFLREGNVI